MKRNLMILVLGIALLTPVLRSQGFAAASGQKTLAATMDVYVFPKAGQDAQQQSKDEAACYAWAVENVGTDPFDLQKRAEQAKVQAESDKQQAQAATQGAGARGAVRGAAAGALIGAIADEDKSDAAAKGAAIGAVSARRRGRRARGQAEQQAEEKKQAADVSVAEGTEKFKKAFSVCLEAKDYLVKF